MAAIPADAVSVEIVPEVPVVVKGKSLPARSTCTPAAADAAAATSTIASLQRSISYTHATKEEHEATSAAQHGGSGPRARFEEFVRTRAVYTLSAMAVREISEHIRELTTTSRSSRQDEFECQICLYNHPIAEGVQLPCGHFFCTCLAHTA